MNTHYLTSHIIPTVRGFILLSRLPFHTVGILPFILGTVLAWHDGYLVRIDVLGLGIVGTCCIMLATYFAGEYYDQEEDWESGLTQKSRFSGGSQAIQQGLVDERYVLTGALIALIAAGFVGVTIWLLFGTGPLTVPLGCLGMAGGFLYSAKPVRWVSHGIGELWIGVCYGWLPVAAAYYLQAGNIPLSISLVAIPICCSIVAVILINEFADYEVDMRHGKRNLLVRLGREKGAVLYMVLVFSAIMSAVIIEYGLFGTYVFQAPFLVLGFILTGMMAGKAYKTPDLREWICAGTLLLNLGITGAWIALLVW